MKFGNPFSGNVFTLFVFGPNEGLEGRVCLRSTKAFRHVGLEHGPGATVTHFFDCRNLLRRPSVEIDRLDLGNVNSEIPVDSGTPDAEEDAKVPRGPSRPFGVTVDAVLIVFVAEKTAKNQLQFVLQKLFFVFNPA